MVGCLLFCCLVFVVPRGRSADTVNIALGSCNGRYKYAVKDLSDAVEVNPEYTIGHVQLGKLQMKLGRCDEAVRV